MKFALLCSLYIVYHVFCVSYVNAQPTTQLHDTLKYHKELEIGSREIYSRKDTTSSDFNAVPMIAFGLGGMFLGVIVGERIDSGSAFEITKAERVGAIVGATTGVTLGYILAKKSQKGEVSEKK